jgi:hypothetical protein
MKTVGKLSSGTVAFTSLSVFAADQLPQGTKTGPTSKGQGQAYQLNSIINPRNFK